ncbi:hypothetical protein EOS_27430 [Caballeronia mineralivorans PML1(12)]|uniref:Uncharacterized protein n=1 Tax=Caballeronia mineralivorans PML1(12) TaxID=908627 RepID=A0A0J1CQS3_9BURK|nr:hypothetical protein EOS_27430 [Caballeronia mineralivorans PML1(12)]
MTVRQSFRISGYENFNMTPFQLPTADAMPHLGETDSQDMSAWLRLANASGLPPIALRAWLAEFGGPPALLTMPDPPPLLYVKGL